jgi:hypothetical protein
VSINKVLLERVTPHVLSMAIFVLCKMAELNIYDGKPYVLQILILYRKIALIHALYIFKASSPNIFWNICTSVLKITFLSI